MCTPEKQGGKTRGEILPPEYEMGWFPEIEEYGYILDLLQELGPCVEGNVVSWSDFKAWVDLTGQKLAGWEIDLLRQLSVLFVAKLNEFRNNHCLSPYAEANRQDIDVSEWMRSVLHAEKENVKKA